MAMTAFFQKLFSMNSNIVGKKYTMVLVPEATNLRGSCLTKTQKSMQNLQLP
jgi:hypothetical protein